MAQSALWLIAQRGYHGTSIADILEASGAPRGSVYYHFPGGKDEMAMAAMEYMATDARKPLEALKGSDAAGVIRGFVNLWRGVLTRSNFAAGCATGGLAVSAETDELRAAAGRVFDLWVGDLTDLFKEAGMSRTNAEEMAWMLEASTEGALMFARAESSMRAMDLVERQLIALASTMLPA